MNTEVLANLVRRPRYFMWNYDEQIISNQDSRLDVVEGVDEETEGISS